MNGRSATSPQPELPGFDTATPGAAAGGAKLPAPSFPRHLWANTTTRKFDTTVSRLTTLVDMIPKLTAENYPTVRGMKAAVLEAWTENEDAATPIKENVFDKMELTARKLGVISDRKKPTTGQYYTAYPAAAAFLTDPDQDSLLAHLLMQMPVSATDNTRETIKLLRFLEECHAAGVEWVSLDNIAFECATQNKESGWRKQAQRVAQRTTPYTNQQILGYMENGPEYREALRNQISRLMTDAAISDDEALDVICETLIPRARTTRKDRLRERLSLPYQARDTDAVVEILCEDQLATKLKSHRDLVKTAVGYRVGVGLIEASSSGYRLSKFGEEALSLAPKTAPDAAGALHALRSTTTSPYEGRRLEREARLDEKRRNNATEAGRHALVENMAWDQYRGERRFAEYEATMVFATLVLVDPTSALNITDVATGIRTRLGFDLTALSAAPGNGADAVVPLTSGAVLVEVSGVEGDLLIQRELEQTLRHLRSYINETGDASASSLLVCPSFSEQLLKHLLAGAEADQKDAARPFAPTVPVTEDQMRRMLGAGADLGHVIAAVRSVVSRLCGTPTWDAARELAETVERLVAEACARAGG